MMDTLAMMSCSLISSMQCRVIYQSWPQCVLMCWKWPKPEPMLFWALQICKINIKPLCTWLGLMLSSVQLSVPWCQEMSSCCTQCFQAEWLWSNRCWSCRGDYKQTQTNSFHTARTADMVGISYKGMDLESERDKSFLKSVVNFMWVVES